MDRIYLDYAASTPVDPRVFRAMKPYFTEKFGNPGSLHSYGQEAMAAVDKSRETIASSIGAQFGEIIFTSGATEANNLALRGVVRTMRGLTQNSFRDSLKPRIIISAIEHESILETARDLEKDGVEVAILPIKKSGVIDIAKFPAMLNEHTVLVSVMYANNETGVIQPIKEISDIIRNFRAISDKGNGNGTAIFHVPLRSPLLHTDAAQAFQFFDCNPEALGVDLMTLSGHKIYAPKGIGALYVRQETRNKEQRGGNSLSHVALPIFPAATGGGQEFGLRSGTENVALIAGFARAVELIESSRESWNKKIEGFRDYFERSVKKIVPRMEVHGQDAPRLPHIAHIYFPDRTAEDMLTYLDLRGVAISAGSACRARSLEPSPVLLAMRYSKDHAMRSVRVSFGRETSKKEIDKMLVIIKNMKESFLKR